MPNEKRSQPLSLELQATSIARRAFQGLCEAAKGGPDRPQIESITVRRRSGDWLVIVRATDLPSFRPMVCFGSGVQLFDAIRNVSVAVAKAQWKPDKFAGNYNR